MTDIDFCLSSYIAFRYLWKDGVDFAEGFQHKNILPIDDNQRIPVTFMISPFPQRVSRHIRVNLPLCR